MVRAEDLRQSHHHDAGHTGEPRLRRPGTGVIPMRHWFGIRRLYERPFQERVLLLLLLIVGGYYLVWSTMQWLTLTPSSLRFDFINYFAGAQAAAHGTDIYAEFKHGWGSEAWVVAYIYPPFFAELLAPLTGLGLLAAARVWLLLVQAALF